MKLSLLAILALSLLLLGCLGAVQQDPAGNCVGSCPLGTHQPAPDDCKCVPDDWAASWESLSIALIFTLIFTIAMLYMVATGMQMPRLKIQLRDELVQAIISGVFVLLLASFMWSAHNFVLPALAHTFEFSAEDLPDSSDPDMPSPNFADVSSRLETTGAIDSFEFAEAYTNEITFTLSGFTAELEETAIAVGSTSSVMTYCQILGSTVGFAIAPCRYLGSTQGTLNLALTALSSAQVVMRAQSLLLAVAKQMFILFFPLGVLLRTIRFTRSAGSAILAIAVGFYIVYPLMVVADYSMVKNHIFVPSSDPTVAWYGEVSIPPGPHNNMGVCRGDAEYLGTLRSREEFIEPMAYWVMIVSIMLPVFNMLVTLTFIRWLSSFLGSEIEVSQLARVV